MKVYFLTLTGENTKRCYLSKLLCVFVFQTTGIFFLFSIKQENMFTLYLKGSWIREVWSPDAKEKNGDSRGGIKRKSVISPWYPSPVMELSKQTQQGSRQQPDDPRGSRGEDPMVLSWWGHHRHSYRNLSRGKHRQVASLATKNDRDFTFYLNIHLGSFVVLVMALPEAEVPGKTLPATWTFTWAPSWSVTRSWGHRVVPVLGCQAQEI